MKFLAIPICILAAASAFAQEPTEEIVDAPAVETLPDSVLLVQILTELNELRSSMERLELRLDILMHQFDGTGDSPAPSEAPADAPAEPSPAEESAPQPTGEFTYDIIKEWGRTPELAAKLGKDISTLIGRVIVVPPWSSDEQLIELGKELRDECADYDNINIEVFDDRVSALQFAESGVAADATRRVMTVSKYGDTGRDIILLIRGETTTTVLP